MAFPLLACFHHVGSSTEHCYRNRSSTIMPLSLPCTSTFTGVYDVTADGERVNQRNHANVYALVLRTSGAQLPRASESGCPRRRKFSFRLCSSIHCTVGASIKVNPRFACSVLYSVLKYRSHIVLCIHGPSILVRTSPSACLRAH